MSLSAKLTDVASYQAYVQDFGDQLISKAFFSPKTVQLAAAAGAVHEGVKGKKTLTTLSVASNKAVAWKSDFSAAADATVWEPRTLTVYAIKRDLSFVPQEFEDTYLGMFRARGQNPGQDMPFEGYVLNQILGKNAEEIEITLWQGARAGSVTAGTTPMNQVIDGFLELIRDAITATDLNPVTTPGGSITTTNIIELVEEMWDNLGAAYKERAVNVYMSWANFKKYQVAYREAYGKYTAPGIAMDMLDFNQNAKLIPMPGMGTSDRIVMTPADNLHVGYDSFADTNLFNFEQNKRVIDFYMDFKIGCQIGLLDDEVIVVNDLT